jgi:hypothetical protein
MISLRFSIPVPFSTVADFATEIVKVTHAIEFTFYGQGGAWKWNPQISVLPPQISLTKPRVVRSSLLVALFFVSVCNGLANALRRERCS